MTKHPLSFSLVGPGRVGSSLTLALVKNGWICRSIVYKKGSDDQIGILKSSSPGPRIISKLSSLRDDFHVLLIAVRDDEIQSVVNHLCSLDHFDWNSKVVLHMSGVKSVKILSPLKKHGAAIGALHPISAFAKRFQPKAANGVYYDFLGDNSALHVVRKITKDLRSKLIILRSDRERVLLHIASAIASNSTVIAVRSAEKLISGFVNSGDAKSLTERLLASTMENLIKNDGIKALTGPIVRGDIGVIQEHVSALENKGNLLQFYKSWSLLGIELLFDDKNSNDGLSRDRQSKLKKIKRLLEN